MLYAIGIILVVVVVVAMILAPLGPPSGWQKAVKPPKSKDRPRGLERKP